MKEFADRIVAELEKGVKPWVRPWDPDKCSGPQAPVNPTTQAVYHGVNVLILAMHAAAFVTGDPRFCTFQQALEAGWHVRKGEKATTIFFTKKYQVQDKDTEDAEKTVRVLRHYPVFHASQIEGIPAWQPPSITAVEWHSDEDAATIMRNSGVPVRIGGDRAFYSPMTDHIQVPPTSAFKNAAEEACVHMHELAHASGAKHRLDRDLSGSFGSAKYAQEELVAELASSFIGFTLNLPTDIPNHASYIDHWLGPLKHDKKMIFHAAASAQRAADWILNHHPDYAVHSEPERPYQAAEATRGLIQPSTPPSPG